MGAGRWWAGWLGVLVCLVSLNARAEDVTIILGGDLAYPSGWPGSDHVDAEGMALFRHIQPLLDASDLRFANLECPITTRRTRQDTLYPMACTPERIGFALDAGFNLLSLANNHILDAGIPGVLDTLDALRRRADQQPLWWAGVGRNRAEANRYASIRLAGKSTTVALFAVADMGLNGLSGLRTSSLPTRIAAAAAQHDVVLVSVHTGVEYKTRPQQEAARRLRELIEAGADLVVGHHPHVAQGVERHGRGIIFHSLGNLSFASRSHRHVDHGVQMLSLLGRVTYRDGDLHEVELIPIFTGNTTAWRLGTETLPPAFATPQIPKGAFADAAAHTMTSLCAAIPEAAPLTLLRRGDRLLVSLTN